MAIRLRLIFTVIVCVGSLVVAAPSFAVEGVGDDAAATRAYLRASEAYARIDGADVGAAIAAIEARASEIAGECPSALTYAPRDAAFGEIGEEVESTLFYVDIESVRALREQFARSVGALSWSNRRLTRLVHRQAADEVALVALKLPDVCADIEAWKSTAYATLPQSAVSFLARSEAIESRGYIGPSEEPLEAVIMRLLRTYEGAGERRAVREIERNEQRTDGMLGKAEEVAWKGIGTALGVSAL